MPAASYGKNESPLAYARLMCRTSLLPLTGIQTYRRRPNELYCGSKKKSVGQILQTVASLQSEREKQKSHSEGAPADARACPARRKLLPRYTTTPAASNTAKTTRLLGLKFLA